MTWSEELALHAASAPIVCGSLHPAEQTLRYLSALRFIVQSKLCSPEDEPPATFDRTRMSRLPARCPHLHQYSPHEFPFHPARIPPAPWCILPPTS